MNANGGINGRQIELIFVDDQSKMDTAMAAIQGLIDQKVDVIIGPFPQWTQPAGPATDRGRRESSTSPSVRRASLKCNEDQTKYTYSFAPATGVDGCVRRLRPGDCRPTAARTFSASATRSP